MEVTYKYVLESAPTTKSKSEFLKDFFDKHFDEFLNKKIMLMISPDLGSNKTLLQFDLDYKLNETNEPDREALRVFNNLKKAFGEYKFNMEVTPGGCHIVSDFNYTRLHEMIDTKKQLESYLGRIKNLDVDASFSPVPFKRIGYDISRNFMYMPTNKPSSKLRQQILMGKIEIHEIFWKEYITNNLLGDDKNMSLIELSKHLEKFNNLMGGKN